MPRSTDDLNLWSHSTVNVLTAGAIICLAIVYGLRKSPIVWTDCLLGFVTGLVLARSLWLAVRNEKAEYGDNLSKSRLVVGVLRRAGAIIGGVAVFAILALAYNWLCF
jgi:hypothetical protein